MSVKGAEPSPLPGILAGLARVVQSHRRGPMRTRMVDTLLDRLIRCAGVPARPEHGWRSERAARPARQRVGQS